MPIRRATDEPAPAAGRRRGASTLACAVAACVLGLGAGCTLFGDDGTPRSQRPSNKWRVAFELTAKSDGTIDFLVAPVDGQPLTVSVPVTLNQTDREIAKSAQRAFTTTLGDAYRINPPTRGDIHVKKSGRKQPDFSLTLIRLTAQDVKVDIDRE